MKKRLKHDMVNCTGCGELVDINKCEIEAGECDCSDFSYEENWMYFCPKCSGSGLREREEDEDYAGMDYLSECGDKE